MLNKNQSDIDITTETCFKRDTFSCKKCVFKRFYLIFSNNNVVLMLFAK